MLRREFLTASLAIAASLRFANSATAAAASLPRIAWTADGNAHDRDDWAASALAIALVGRAGAAGRLAHFDFNSHAPTSAGAWESQMQTSVWGASDRWRVSGMYWDNRPNSGGAAGALANRINESSATNSLTIAIAGPCQTLYNALERSNRSKLAYVRFLSHSSWNTDHKHNGSKNWADCKARFGPLTLQTIPNQNINLNTNGDWRPWHWLRDSSSAKNRWLYQRMQASGKPDVSDAGMMYYLLHGNSMPTPADFRAKLG